ncbi:MFS family permease [Pseudarthrobacter sp. PvP004]|uniref:MFS transporter n=1 Tax=Pseudarthrobacter sp. PvP004 TaxID=2817850 RepID=UPI001AE842CE|nr:MFS transporter [Pseudarthrobacter sp. PvP004]MBP2266327.1 MFS family permease [Pseudarthrobacter sp. PvP004]
MSSRDIESKNTVPPAAFPLASSLTDVADERPETTKQELPKVNARYIWFMVLAQFGVFVAFITPLAISLSIRVQALAPGHEEYLGYITGAGAFTVMLVGPIAGVLSDRTRTKIGRRRPWMIGGTILGVLSLFVMALSPNIFILGLGWILAQMGWGQVLGNLQISTADRLPESQRGKVAGLTGFATQVAPVFGVVIAGSFSQQNLLLFLVPGLVGVVLVALFVLLVHEDDSRSRQFAEKLSLKAVGKKYLYNPKQYPDYSWNWAGRFLFYFGLTLNTTFTAFFFASKLGVGVADVAPLIATIGGAGILATTVGALGGGFLSDRLRRRRVFVLGSAMVFAAGAVLMAFAPDMPLLIAGSLLTSVGIGGFAAVDQALLLDVLPERDTDAGRFMSITGFATSVPQAFAPFIAPLILVIGATENSKNYELLYLIAGAVTILGGLSVLRIKSVR